MKKKYTENLKWTLNRLKSMNIKEVTWRIQQKLLQKKEYNTLYSLHCPVTDIPLTKDLKEICADSKRIPFNAENGQFSFFESLDIFGVFDYQYYKKKWNAGFQTENVWPEDMFSPSISISQREDIGDIRTNWELNRHYQFACLAKNYYVTGEKKYFSELAELFDDWNKHNLFLHGVEWASAMEVGIRVISWIYTYVFISHAIEKYKYEGKGFTEKICHGILVMTEYIIKHRARFSSANNHLIVEMFAVGMSGILFEKKEWIQLSTDILTKELPGQNYEDGVNKEMSLHYQSFIMEAYGILWLSLIHNRYVVPEPWKRYLSPMSRYMADCCGDFGETVVFGDNDEGKLLDLQGRKEDHYRYVLQLMGMLLDKRYTAVNLTENICWITTKSQQENYYKKQLYIPDLVSHYKKGGYTILRSRDHKVLIGMDHAELGFGSIAAHGHADALSIQVYYEGKPALTDAGTYNYHVPKKIRNEIRSAKAHNTVYVEDKEQAEQLGPFLWGKRFLISNTEMKEKGTNVELSAEIVYGDIRHKRLVEFDYDRKLSVTDIVEGAGGRCTQVWNTDKNISVNSGGKTAGTILNIKTDAEDYDMKKGIFSMSYNNSKEADKYFFIFTGKIKTIIEIG